MTKEEILKSIWAKSCLLWTIDNGIKNESGNLLEFKNHRFLKDIYDDFSRVMVVRKASQIGFSVMKILKSLYAANYKKLNIIYTLPTFQDVGQFVPSKINAIISQNPMLAKWTKDKDTVLQKKVGNNFIYYRGTFTKEQDKMAGATGIMFTSDLNIHDECDRSDQSILEQYESRLEASSFGGRWYFSNPSSPQTLSQKIWEKSDQKHWFVKCSHCNLKQYLDFWKNIRDGKYVCHKCGGEITDEDRRQGEWVKKWKDNNISGYWIPHMICPWISAGRVEDSEKNKSKQYFYNFVLGLPYIGSEVSVNKDIILQNIDDNLNFLKDNVMGVDVGIVKHYIVGNKEGIHKIGKCEKWEEIEEMIKIYDIKTVVIDAMPDITEPRKLLKKYLGKVWIHYYKKEIRKSEFIKWDCETHTVYSDRTKIIQQVIDNLVNHKIKFQMKIHELEDYIKSWKNVYKKVEKDSLDIENEVWETVGEDHFIHATVYFLLALEKSGDAIISEWGRDKEPYTGLAPDIQQIIKEEQEYE